METTFELKKISVNDALLQDIDTSIFLDVRTLDIYRKVHFDRFINSCVYEVAFYENITHQIKDKTTKILTYNHKKDSIEADTAAKKLLEMGYTNVYIIDGYYQDLIDGGFELIGDEEYLEDNFIIEDGDYSFQSGTVSWIGRNASGKHFGEVQIKSAFLGAYKNKLSGETTIDMNKISNDDIQDASLNSMLIDHLKSEDFFSVSKFQEASFKIEEGFLNEETAPSDKNLTLEGELTILGITKPITILGNISKKNDSIVLQSHFDFDRTLWNIFYGSAKFFPFLGIHLIFDPISIEVRIEFKKLS